MPYHHLILPLASRRDKVTQVRWGLRDFRRRFDRDAEGHPIEPDRRYRVAPESGAIAVGLGDEARKTVSGSALLALGGEATPDRDCLRELKWLFRELVTHQLAGRGLHAWDLAAAIRLPMMAAEAS